MAPLLNRVGFSRGFGRRVSRSFSATGGTVTAQGITPGNGYRYHVFTAPGTFTVNGSPGFGEVLIVAGGGSGGGVNDGVGGGGGAGGVVYYTSYIFSSPISVTVGSGAPTGPAPGPGVSGNDTVFGATTAKGGGGGSHSNRFVSYGPPTGNPGGSGGGGNGFDSPRPGGLATQPSQPLIPGFGGTNYGNAGGAGPGGGGGSGSGGTTSSGGNAQPFPGFAGPLISPEIPAPNVSVIGPTGLYGGGGGGGAPGNSGGSGGGGAGNTGLAPGAGSPATGYGSGGGGAWIGSPGGIGGSGSPGIVIVRYLV